MYPSPVPLCSNARYSFLDTFNLVEHCLPIHKTHNSPDRPSLCATPTRRLSISISIRTTNSYTRLRFGPRCQHEPFEYWVSTGVSCIISVLLTGVSSYLYRSLSLSFFSFHSSLNTHARTHISVSPVFHISWGHSSFTASTAGPESDHDCSARDNA